jgi:hypothetical protein
MGTCTKHLPGSLVERLQLAHPPSRAAGVFHRPPEACHGVEGVPTASREHLPLPLSGVRSKSRSQCVSPLDAPVRGLNPAGL